VGLIRILLGRTDDFMVGLFEGFEVIFAVGRTEGVVADKSSLFWLSAAVDMSTSKLITINQTIFFTPRRFDCMMNIF